MQRPEVEKVAYNSQLLYLYLGYYAALGFVFLLWSNQNCLLVYRPTNVRGVRMLKGINTILKRSQIT